MSSINSNVKIIKSSDIEIMELEINKLLKQGYKLWGEMKIDFDRSTKKYDYHQMLYFDKLIYLRQNYHWSDWE